VPFGWRATWSELPIVAPALQLPLAGSSSIMRDKFFPATWRRDPRSAADVILPDSSAERLKTLAADRSSASSPRGIGQITAIQHWPDLRIAEPTVSRNGPLWSFSVAIDLGSIASEDVVVQLYAEPRNGGSPFVGELCRVSSSAPAIYTGTVPADRPATDYTVRIVPRYPGAAFPTELPLILWQKTSGRAEEPDPRLMCINARAAIPVH